MTKNHYFAKTFKLFLGDCLHYQFFLGRNTVYKGLDGEFHGVGRGRHGKLHVEGIPLIGLHAAGLAHAHAGRPLPGNFERDIGLLPVPVAVTEVHVGRLSGFAAAKMQHFVAWCLADRGKRPKRSCCCG